MVIIVRTVSERVHLRFLEKSFSGDFATSAGERDLTREIRDFWTLGIEYFIKCASLKLKMISATSRAALASL
jgi:hypothetical protein